MQSIYRVSDTIVFRSGAHLYSIVCCDIKFKSHTNYGSKNIINDDVYMLVSKKFKK